MTRVRFWIEQFQDIPINQIDEDMVDDALSFLSRRGKLKNLPNGLTVETGEKLAPATENRYVGQLGSIFKFAKTERILKRSFQPPTVGIRRQQEKPNPNKFITEEQVEKLIAIARVKDKRWKKMPALIQTAFQTGLRVGSLMSIRWKDVDLDERTIFVAKTKNGDPISSRLSHKTVSELRKLPKDPNKRVFGNAKDQPFHYRKLWMQIAAAARIDQSFHALRHGCGYTMAKANISQAMIMKTMGHKTLSASARYTHASAQDLLNVTDSVFK